MTLKNDDREFLCYECPNWDNCLTECPLHNVILKPSYEELPGIVKEDD